VVFLRAYIKIHFLKKGGFYCFFLFCIFAFFGVKLEFKRMLVLMGLRFSYCLHQINMHKMQIRKFEGSKNM